MINLGIANYLSKMGADKLVLHISNAFLLFISLASIFMQSKAMHHKNPNVFVRAVMGGMMLKMMSIGGAVLIYYFLSGDTFSKTSVVVSLLYYLIYLSTEVIVMTKLNRRNHA
jgi:hypothetical protein